MLSHQDPGDVVYETSSWERHLYGKAKDADQELKLVEHSGESRFGAWPSVQRELYSRLYADDIQPLPEDQRPQGLEWAGKVHEQAADLPEWKRLVNRTRGDSFASTVATCAVADEVLRSMPEEAKQKRDPRDLQQQIEDLQDLINQGGSQKSQKAAQNALQQAQVRLQQALAQGAAVQPDPGAVRQALRAAAQKANDKISEAENAMCSMGWDNSQPSNTGTTADEKIMLARMLRSDRKIQEIAKLAGRLRRIASQKQRSKVNYGCAEVADIEQGNDLARLLPAELIRLRHPILRRQWMADFLERKLLQYRLDSKDTEAEGPIVFCVDESGSMDGAPLTWAKAVFLAMLEIAKKQKRTCAYVGFSDYGHTFTSIFEPGKFNAVQTMQVLQHFFNGGTDFTTPIQEAFKVIEQNGRFKKADVILLTDGYAAELDWKWFETEKKRLNCSFFPIIIGMDTIPLLDRIGTPNKTISISDFRPQSVGEEQIVNTLFNI